MKLIYSLTKIVALEDGDENVDIDATIEALDKKITELTTMVDSAVKAAEEHVQQRLAIGEAKSATASLTSKDDDDRNSVASVSSSLASKKRREAEAYS